MHAQPHADRGVDDLGGKAVLIHIRNAGVAAVGALTNVRKLADFGPLVPLGDAEPGTVDETQRNWAFHAVDDKGFGAIVLGDNTRCGVAVFGLNVVDIAVGRLTDVAVG